MNLNSHDHKISDHPGLHVGFAVVMAIGVVVYLLTPYRVTLEDTRPPVEFVCPDKAISCRVEYRDSKGKNRNTLYTCFKSDHGRCDVNEIPATP